jgi:hypothetical protein
MSRTRLRVLLVLIVEFQAVLWAVPQSRPSPQQTQKVAAQIAKIAMGSEIEVRLFSKEKLRGRLGEVSDTGFVLLIPTGNSMTKRNLAFDQVKSVRLVKRRARGGPALPIEIAAVIVAVILIITFH